MVPLGKWLWREKSTEAMLAFLGGMRVGRISARWRLLEGGVGASTGDEERRVGQVHRMCKFLCYSLFFSFSLSGGLWEE